MDTVSGFGHEGRIISIMIPKLRLHYILFGPFSSLTAEHGVLVSISVKATVRRMPALHVSWVSYRYKNEILFTYIYALKKCLCLFAPIGRHRLYHLMTRTSLISKLENEELRRRPSGLTTQVLGTIVLSPIPFICHMARPNISHMSPPEEPCSGTAFVSTTLHGGFYPGLIQSRTTASAGFLASHEVHGILF